jgi:hypothetical protein
VAENKVHADKSPRQVQSESTPAGAGLQPTRARLLDFKAREEKKTVQQWDLEEYFLLEREMHAESTALWKAKHG